MNWINFPLYCISILLLWAIGLFFLVQSYKNSKKTIFFKLFFFLGWMVLVGFIIQLWLNLNRPPMRTLGETRLWYSVFLPVIGYISFMRWRYKWFLGYSFGLASVFLIVNYFNPETYSKTLMPALQSPWFIPHVLVYLFSYAVLAASCIVALKGLFTYYKTKRQNLDILLLADNLVYIGFAFLTLGLLFGALWAKEAWGHYWTWDPKETWAFLTWIAYLIYIHYRYFHPFKTDKALWILSVAFIVLIICWFGMSYLPVAKYSVHTYVN